MKTLNLTVLGIDINPNPGMDMDVDLALTEDEYYGVLSNFNCKEIIDKVGTEDLLRAMDTDVIIRYLNDIGVYAGWEE